METKNSSLMRKKKGNDNCPICKRNLYLDNRMSKRVGILNEFDEVEEWMCPYCDSQFEINGKPTVLYGTMNVEGEA